MKSLRHWSWIFKARLHYHGTRWMMTGRRLHGFFFSSSLCLKMQKLKTREWREKWKGNGETKKMRWMKELVFWEWEEKCIYSPKNDEWRVEMNINERLDILDKFVKNIFPLVYHLFNLNWFSSSRFSTCLQLWFSSSRFSTCLQLAYLFLN